LAVKKEDIIDTNDTIIRGYTTGIGNEKCSM
jgi:hypothetical protein